MRRRSLTTAVLVLVCTLPLVAQDASVHGADSPQAVVAAVQKATDADDLGMAVPFIAPEARRALAKEGITGMLMALAFSDPDDVMPGSKSLPKAELEKKRKAYKSAVDMATRTLHAHGIDGVVGKPVLAEATQKPITEALEQADTVALMRDMLKALGVIGPMLGMKKSGKQVPFALVNVTDYVIKGDKATAKAENETLDFVKIDGRWYLTPPAPAGGV